jgi:hypothetical protein
MGGREGARRIGCTISTIPDLRGYRENLHRYRNGTPKRLADKAKCGWYITNAVSIAPEKMSTTHRD